MCVDLWRLSSCGVVVAMADGRWPTMGSLSLLPLVVAPVKQKSNGQMDNFIAELELEHNRQIISLGVFS